MDSQRIIAHQRAEFRKAESNNLFAGIAQALILCVALTVVFASDDRWIYGLTVLNLIIAVAWRYFAAVAKRSHELGEKARRAVLYHIGMGVELSKSSERELIASFSTSIAGEGEDGVYYASVREAGQEKLAEMIEESAFWSGHLFAVCARRHWIYFSTSLIVAIVLLLAIPLIGGTTYFLSFSQTVCVVLTWLVSSSLLESAQAFQEGAHTASIIETRLANSPEGPDVLVTVADYNSLVERMPTIPSGIYESNRERLNELWGQRE